MPVKPFHQIYITVINLLSMINDQEDSEPLYQYVEDCEDSYNSSIPVYIDKNVFTSDVLIKTPKTNAVYRGQVIRQKHWFHTDFFYQHGNDNIGFNTVLKTIKILNGYEVIARCENKDISIAVIRRNLTGSRYLLIEKDFTCCHKLCNIDLDVDFDNVNKKDKNNRVNDVYNNDQTKKDLKCRKMCSNHMKHKETFAVEYEQNIIKNTGPRRIKAYFTGFDDHDMPSLSYRLKKRLYDKVISLSNKLPEYNYTIGSYMLNFRGRVTKPSVKNFQLVHPMAVDIIYLTFGKTDKNSYVLDFKWPLNCVQAFFFAITALDFKVGCE